MDRWYDCLVVLVKCCIGGSVLVISWFIGGCWCVSVNNLRLSV